MEYKTINPDNMVPFNKDKLVQLFKKYEIGLFTKEELENRLPVKLSSEEVNSVLDTTLAINDDDAFREIFDFFSEHVSVAQEVTMCRKYLLNNSHRMHEEIASTFQVPLNDDKDNIPCLLKALDQIPEYLQGDEHPYIRKIIYAIGAQSEPYNFEALEKLSGSGDEQTRDLALHQLEKRKELGRWEATKKG